MLQPKNTKKTRAEKMKAQKEEEKQIYKTEHALLDTERQPQSATDFDRLVLQSPDSSLVWLRYMAYHLETTEIEKARAVAERALKTISFRYGLTKSDKLTCSVINCRFELKRLKFEFTDSVDTVILYLTIICLIS